MAAPRARVTKGATETRFWGLAEFIAAEELSRQRGYWWSPDGKQLLALNVDERDVPVKTRAQIFSDRTTMTQQRYPGAGENNARVTAWTLQVADGRMTPLPLPSDAEYIARAGWFGDGTPWLQTLTRDQHKLALTEYANGAGPGRTVIDERDPAWVEVHDDLQEIDGLTLSGQPALLWSSESSGRRQLVLVDRRTGERRPLTNEPEPVAHRVCSDGKTVVYAAARDRGRSRELFAIDLNGTSRPLDGAQPRQWRDARGDGDCARVLVTRGAWGEPPALSLQSVKAGAKPLSLPGDAPDALLARIVPKPAVVDVTAADGRTPLNALYFAPLDGKAGPHPVITMAYGGPGTSTTNWNWSRDTALIAYWQRRGYGVFTLDTRGMQNRDREFTRAHRLAFGAVDVNDLFAAVRQLPKQVAGVDPTRIGFFGWSYGGFLAERAMLDADTPLASAVAVAPPTDWTLYDTAYTERYLGMPQGGKDGQSDAYRQSNLVMRAKLLTKPLLIVHGTADDNVLFEHTLRLTEALQNEARPFELMIYPGKAHGIAGRSAKLHLYRTIDAFFARTLAR
ncbi:alpha/beta fold hydrolase [Roseateles sp. UC29_93]|uniref:S9 family peptidase n=1 Tax=Roseateles sp. UC29_93 TaxID=3350177 RepID=UPI00367200E3